MINKEVSARWTMEQVVSHKYLASVVSGFRICL